MTTYRKTATVEAIQYTGNNVAEVKTFSGEYFFGESDDNGDIFFKTLEGVEKATPGYYILKGIDGEIWPCKQDIFERTYEVVDGT